MNDPFAGGTHLNDITVVAPCFVGDELVGWVANRAHHADVGGIAPGSMPADATEISEEGLRIPPIRLDDRVAELIATSSRTPVERRGDLDAQRGANRLGVARMALVVAALGSVAAARGGRRLRGAPHACRVARIPDGRWHAEDVLDSAGPRPEQQSPTRVAVTLTVDGEHAVFDFTGTDAQRAGNVNAVEAVTVERGRVRDPRRDRSDDAGERGRDAARPRDHATGHRRRRDPARRGRRGQRRGEPARGRRLPAPRSRRRCPIGSAPRARAR